MAPVHPMRRTDRQVSEAEAREILARAEYGVLATAGAGGWPYAVPVNHYLEGDCLYIHCAAQGHKLENIAHDGRVCFCAVSRAEVLPAQLSTAYESAVVFGRARLVAGGDERRAVLERFARRFVGELSAQAMQSFDAWFPRTVVLRVDIERITGKAHRAFTSPADAPA